MLERTRRATVRLLVTAALATLLLGCGGAGPADDSIGSAVPPAPVEPAPEPDPSAAASAATSAAPAPTTAPGTSGPPADAGAPDSGPPTALTLDTSVVSKMVEPEGSGKDDLGHAYTDANYWNFCSAGAVAAALYSFRPLDVTGWPAGAFLEPSHAPSTLPAGGTWWKSGGSAGGYATLGRAYLMYIAMQVKPPSFSAPGVDSFASYPSTGGNLNDMRDVLNWEASGHASTWKTFHYVVVPVSSVTAAKLHADIVNDVTAGHAVVAAVDTTYLPNWSRSLSHAITVIGFSDTAKTYTYVDTCGVRCNGSASAKNGGVWTVAQSQLYLGIKNDGAGYIH